MKNIIFIAWHDVRNQLRQGSTLVWVFLMPPIFFYFIGTVTGGFSSGLSVLDFMKRSSILKLGPESLGKLAPSAMKLAKAEGLEAHARSVSIRLNKER